MLPQFAQSLNTAENSLVRIFVDGDRGEFRLADTNDRSHDEHHLRKVDRMRGWVTSETFNAHFCTQSIGFGGVIVRLVIPEDELRQCSCKDSPREKIASQDQC